MCCQARLCKYFKFLNWWKHITRNQSKIYFWSTIIAIKCKLTRKLSKASITYSQVMSLKFCSQKTSKLIRAMIIYYKSWIEKVWKFLKIPNSCIEIAKKQIRRKLLNMLEQRWKRCKVRVLGINCWVLWGNIDTRKR